MNIICLGDSFTVGPMVDQSETWVSILDQELPYTFINRGISGDTTSGMLSRLRQDVINLQPEYALIVGGANDLICGGGPGIVRNNMMAMIHHLFHCRIKPVIGTPIPCISEMIPPIWRDVYDFSHLNEELEELDHWAKDFSKAFLCSRLDLFSTMLEALEDPGFRGGAYLDGLHLSAAGHRFIANQMKTQLGRILR